MKLEQILEKRQSIRKYKEGDIPKADIKKIIAAAGMAPSGKNIQNWHFIAITNKDVINKIAQAVTDKNQEIVDEMMKIDESKALRFQKFCKNFTVFFTKAPLLTVVYTKDYMPSGYFEYKLINGSKEILDNLLYKKNPGMQSLGAALENFTLKAIELGYGSCWLTSANYASEEIEAIVREACGFEADGYFMGALMSVGIPEENQKSPSKKPLEEILTLVE